MTSKERVHAALAGQPVDRTPVASSYTHLYFRDHFAELTGKEPWELHKWLNAEPKDHLEAFKRIIERVPFDILQPETAPSRQARQDVEFIARNGQVFRHSRRSGRMTPVTGHTVSGHASDYAANETQYVFDKKDVAERVKVAKAEEAIEAGANDYIAAVVKALGRDQFVMSGGVTGTLWGCTSYLGQTNLLGMLVENPGLVDYLSQRVLEQNIETIRRMAAAGGDAIFIDDALSTCDMISVRHYERFSLPYVTEMVREIHRLGHKAVLIYFGGVADRLEQIASTGADALAMEASMKGYVNDIGEAAARIGQRISLFGNVDPVGVLQDGTDAQLESELRRQARAAKKARGLVMSTGSPITPATPLGRVRRFIELGRQECK